MQASHSQSRWTDRGHHVVLVQSPTEDDLGPGVRDGGDGWDGRSKSPYNKSDGSTSTTSINYVPPLLYSTALSPLHPPYPHHHSIHQRRRQDRSSPSTTSPSSASPARTESASPSENELVRTPSLEQVSASLQDRDAKKNANANANGNGFARFVRRTLRSRSVANLREEVKSAERSASVGRRDHQPPPPVPPLPQLPPAHTQTYAYTGGANLSTTDTGRTFLLPVDPFSAPSTRSSSGRGETETETAPIAIPHGSRSRLPFAGRHHGRTLPSEDAHHVPRRESSSSTLSPTLSKSTPRDLDAAPEITLRPHPSSPPGSPERKREVVKSQGRVRPRLVSNRTAPAVLGPPIVAIATTATATATATATSSAPPTRESFFDTIKRQSSIKNIFNLASSHKSASYLHPTSTSTIVVTPPISSLPPVLEAPRPTESARSASAPPQPPPQASGSFYDLYAELGITPPSEDDVLERTFERSERINSGVVKRDFSSDVGAKRLSKEVLSSSSSQPPPPPPPPQSHAKARSPRSPPPSLPLPEPLRSPLLHAIPWPKLTHDADDDDHDDDHHDDQVDAHSSFDYNDLIRKYERMSRGSVAAIDIRGTTDERSQSYSRAPPPTASSSSTFADSRTFSSFRSHQGVGRDRRRSNESRSDRSKAKDAPLPTSSPVSMSRASSDDDVERTTEFYSSDSDDEEEGSRSVDSDDVPLGERIPQAIIAQKALMNKHKEARRERRAAAAAAHKAKNVRGGRIDGRDSAQWKGEGGVPARQLSAALEAELTKLAAQRGPDGKEAKTGLGLGLDVSAGKQVWKAAEVEAAARKQQSPLTTSTSSARSRQTSLQRSADTSPALHSLSGRLSDQNLPSRIAPHRPQVSRKISRQPCFGPTSRSDTEWLALSPPRSPRQHRSPGDSAGSTSASSNDARRPPVATRDTTTTEASSKASSPRSRAHTLSPLLESHPHFAGRPRQSPAASPSVPAQAARTVQQRVFVGSLQGHCEAVDIDPLTTAADILQMLQSRGVIKCGQSEGMDWVLYEFFGEMGCERPIRSFENINQIIRGWNPEVRLNTFLLKRSSNIRLVSAETVGRVAPFAGAYVQWESRKGKWTKRWLETRKGLIFLAKNDKGKDEVFLCHASAFNVFTFTRPYKGPKGFAFALKSYDSPALFENKDDYVHIFTCDLAAGPQIYEALYLATSNCLIADRNNSPPMTHSQRTTKETVTKRRPTVREPLIDMPHHGVFAPGSLLSRIGGKS